MSSVTTSLINTANGTTSLGLRTGNTSGPRIELNTSNQVTLKANSTVNTVIANTTSTTLNVPLNVNGAITSTNTATGNVISLGTDNQNREINISGGRTVFGYDGSNAYVEGGTDKGVNLVVNGATDALSVNSVGHATFSNNVTVTNNITAANANITSNTFTLGSSSIAPSGFTTMPNGLKLVWGSATISSSTTTVTFPSAFSSVVYNIQLTNTEDGKLWVTASNTTTFTADNQAASSTVYYMAIGV
jgi:hypothetical protein